MLSQSAAIKMAKSFIRDCEAAGISIQKALLFGSFAAQTQRADSDIDILLVSNLFTDNLFENLKLYTKINIRYPRIETHPYPSAYAEKGDDFINIAKESGINLLE
jgi:predicted nucleotidyltransferase